MTSQSRKRPAYLRISDALRDKIERNELEPGQKFPTERELVREFHVARMTVRHALDILEVEGLIDRRRGRSGGTYVRTVPPTLSLTNEDNIVTQLRERGHDTAVRVVSVNKAHVPKHVAAVLGVSDSTFAWDIKRLYTVDGKPVILSRYTIPVDMAPDLNQHDLREPIMEILAGYNLKPVFKRESMRAATARTEEQKLLHVSRSHPLLRFVRLLKTKSGAVFAYIEESLRSDIANVEVILGEDPAPQPLPGQGNGAGKPA
ncbi:GntR family transcriptional regulator [Corynebacterium tuberculostearicum]|uniref:GntR family transcriptional regulator n=1 Tax=Corynebacterium tuberculostearicum TaxID=38304 RepID=UPI00195C5813|nr:GntR family transcriptional regulator [Corynebacterium tuberculostearicum]QRQ68043.1 GntR family transcriptional regulator [Corynebacterium tuberculostearicum]